jgi:hypothetical protein
MFFVTYSELIPYAALEHRVSPYTTQPGLGLGRVGGGGGTLCMHGHLWKLVLGIAVTMGRSVCTAGIHVGFTPAHSLRKVYRNRVRLLLFSCAVTARRLRRVPWSVPQQRRAPEDRAGRHLRGHACLSRGCSASVRRDDGGDAVPQPYGH